MTGRDVARHFLGLSGGGSPRAQIPGAPETPEELSALTGMTWRWVDTEGARLLTFYNYIRPGRREPRWEEFTSARTPSTRRTAWDALIGSRHGRWLLLYKVPANFDSVMGFSAPELDREGAQKVWSQLRELGLRTAIWETDSPLFQFIMGRPSPVRPVWRQTVRALEPLGFQDPYPAVTNIVLPGVPLDAPGNNVALILYQVLLVKQIIDALEQHGERIDR